MSLKHAVQFGLLALIAALAAEVNASHLAAMIVLIWTAAAFAFVSLAYLLGRPSLLMKRGNGSQPIMAWILLWPYLLFARFSLWLYRVTHRHSLRFAQVVPNLWFARRLTKTEIARSGVRWHAVLDLAAEFPRTAPAAAHYLSLPMLDGAPSSREQLSTAITWLDDQMQHGPVLVHCALGHGRSGSVVLSWLLTHQQVPDIKAGIAMLAARRSTFGISRSQTAGVERFAAMNSATSIAT